jgi:hypothetical protein
LKILNRPILFNKKYLRSKNQNQYFSKYKQKTALYKPQQLS